MAADREAQFQQLEDLSQEDLARFILSMIHRMNIHHTLWFRETEHQLGMERALDILEQVTQQSSRNEIQRLGKVLGFEVQDGIPKPLLDLPREKLLELTGEIGKNWLAMDGLWFQAIERAYGMNDANAAMIHAGIVFPRLKPASLKVSWAYRKGQVWKGSNRLWAIACTLASTNSLLSTKAPPASSFR